MDDGDDNDPTFSLESNENVHRNNDSMSIITQTEHKISLIESSSLNTNVVNRSDIDEIVVDDKIREFIDYIEQSENNSAETILSKHEFKEYLEQPKRLRYPSYNHDPDTTNDEYIQYNSNYEQYIDNDYDNEHSKLNDLANEIEIENKQNDSNSQQTINNRKPNMFALPMHKNIDEQVKYNLMRPVIRITSTEDERIEQFICENYEDDSSCSSIGINPNAEKTEKLRKSQTLQLFTFNDNDTYVNDLERDSESRAELRCESLLSEISCDSNQFVFKDDAKRSFSREDSCLSNKSNRLHERSESMCYELEYIKGRDDWKDNYSEYRINEQIDSDNYHHLRRHSEAADTLEYIRGREDWMKNEMRSHYRNSLSRIFETGESRILIRDEIDSDEYHHNFFLHDSYRSASETIALKQHFADQHFGRSNSTNDAELNSSGFYSQNSNDTSLLQSNVDVDNIMKEDNFDNENAPTTVAAVIEDLINHETNHNEEIEITVLDLKTSNSHNKQQQQQQQKEEQQQQEEIIDPFIIISEATDDEREIIIDDIAIPRDNSNFLNTNTKCKTKSVNVASLESETHIMNENDNNIAVVEVKGQSFETELDLTASKIKLNENITDFLDAEIQNENNNRNIEIKADKIENVETAQISKKIQIEHTPENEQIINHQSTASELKSNAKNSIEQPKSKNNMKQNSFEELIAEVSFGPWFHK